MTAAKPMTQSEALDSLSQLLAGMQVPISLFGQAGLGVAGQEWSKWHQHVQGFGYAEAAQYREALVEALLGPATCDTKEGIQDGE